MKKYSDFIEEMQVFLGFEVWHQKNKYVIAGREYVLGESIADVLNFDFSLIDKPFQDMELILSRTPQSKIPNMELIGMTQNLTNKMIDALMTVKPFSGLPIELSQFKDRLTAMNTLNREVFTAYLMRFYVLRADILRTQLLYKDLLDNYFDRDNPDNVPIAYEKFLGDCVDMKHPKYYSDASGKTYLARQIAEISSPMAIDFGIPPTGTSLSGICEIVRFISPFDFYHWELMKALMAGIEIKRCKWCGRVFHVERGYSYEYCDMFAPGETERTCRMIGSMKSHEAKVKNDPIWLLYRRAYKKFHARVLKKHMTQDEFMLWADAALRLRDQTIADAKDALNYPLDAYSAKLNDPELFKHAAEQ